jgi:4-amino-4-deoxy-L-arabinose transferase-like glycosyltransferase
MFGVNKLDINNHQQLAIISQAYIVFHSILWFVIAVVSRTAPHKDNIEELNWLQYFDWGYPKFGPISTWWLHIFVELFERAMWVTYLAGMVNIALMLLIVWRIALLISTPARALMAVVLTSVVVYHNINGLQVNPNLIQLFPTALFLLAVLLAVQQQQWWRWVLLGLVGTVCLLTKYAAGIWIAVMGIWLLCDQRTHNKRALSGVAIAIVAGALAMIPHIEWLIRTDAPPIRYMQHQFQADTNHFIEVGKFILSQLGKLSPLIVTVFVVNLLFKRDKDSTFSFGYHTENTAESRFVSFTAYGPMLITCVLGAFWINLNSNWGTAYFVLIGLYALRFLPKLDSPLLLKRVFRIGLTINIAIACGYGLYYGILIDVLNKTGRANYPAAAQGVLIDQVWDAKKRGPLKVVIGETWTAGISSVMSRDQPLVMPYGVPSLAPAITPDLIKKCGALIVLDLSQARYQLTDNLKHYMQQATETGTVDLYWNKHKPVRPFQIQWSIIEPESPGACR